MDPRLVSAGAYQELRVAMSTGMVPSSRKRQAPLASVIVNSFMLEDLDHLGFDRTPLTERGGADATLQEPRER